MIDRKIDSFITTNNGINTHTYTGNELGKKAFVAKTSNVESTPYEVTDCLYYDEGLSADGHHNDSMWSLVNATKYRQSDGTVFASNTSSTASGYAFVHSNQAEHSPNCIIEFDILERTYRNQMGFLKNTSTRWDVEFNAQSNGGIGHWRFVITPTSQEAFFKPVNSETETSVATGTKNFDANIRINLCSVYASSTHSSLKIANFKMYSI